MNPEKKIGEQMKLSFSEQEKPKTSPVEDFIALQKKVANENNILNHEILTLKDDVWYVGSNTLEEYNEIHAEGNHNVYNKGY